MGLLDRNFLVPIDETTADVLADTAQRRVETDAQAIVPAQPEADARAPALNVMGARHENPDQKAADLDLAKQVGQDASLISDETRPVLQDQVTQRQLEDSTREAPVLRSFLSRDKVLPALAHDDIPNLVRIEKAAKDLTFTGVFGTGVDLLQGLGYRFIEATGEALDAETLEEFGARGAEEQFAAVEQVTGGKRQRFVGIQTAEDFFQWIKETSAEQIPLMAPAVTAGLAGAAAGTAILPGVGTAIGGILGAFIPSFILGVGETQQAIKERDPSVEAPGFAFGAGALIGALDSALPGKVGTTLVKAFGLNTAEQLVKLTATRIMRNAAVAGGKGMALEGITEAIQEVISETAAATATDTEINAEELTSQMIEAFAAGAFLGGSISTTVSVGSDVMKARRVKKGMDALDASVSASKLKGRAPDKAAELIAADLRKAGIDKIFIPTEAILQYANQHPDGVTAALNELGVTESLPNAIQSGEDVEVGAEAFSRSVLGTASYGVLAPHIKLSAQDKSLNEAAEAIVSDEEIETELAAELEAYDASEELKARVTETLNKVKAGTVAQAIDDAPIDVNAVLMDLIQRVQERRGGVAETVKAGRVRQLDVELADIDKAIAETQDEIDAREGTTKPTKALEKRLDTLVTKRNTLIDEQADLGLAAVPDTGLRQKQVKVKGKVLQDLGVKITTEAIRATRAAFKAGIKLGETITQKKTALVKEIDKLPLTDKQQKQLGDRIFKTKTVAQLNKVAQAVQSRAAILVESERRKQIKAAVKKTLQKTRAKKVGGKLVGRFDADTQDVLDLARETMSLGAEAAALKLEAALADPLPTAEGVFERQLLALAANDDSLNNVDAENLLIDIVKIKQGGADAALDRILGRRKAKLRDIMEGREATTQGQPVAELKSTGFFLRLKNKAADVRTSLSSMHNGWDEVLDIIFNKRGVDASRLIENLRMTRVVQQWKGRMLRWEQELIQIGIDAFQLDGHGQLTDRHHEDARRIDFGEFVNKRGEKVRLEYSKAEIRKLWMERQDLTIREVVQHEQGNAFTDEMMRAMFKELDQTDYDYANAQLAFYRKIYPQVNAVHRRIYGVNLPFNEFYSPIQRDKGDVSPDGSRDSFGSDRILADEMTFRRSLPKQLKSRTANIFPLLRRSDVGAMHRYLHDMAWFIETTEKVLHVKGVFDSQSLRKDIKAHHGNSMLRFIDSFLEDFGTGYASRGMVAEQAIGAINRRFSASVLALKGTIGTKQLVSWLAMADNVPILDFMKSHADFFKSRAAAKDIIKFLWENSAALRERGSSIDFELAKIGALEEPVFRWKHEQRMQDIFFSIIRMGDRFPIYAGGWAVYQNALKQGKTHEQAILAFEDAMESTQQSVDIDKMSALQRSGAIGRTLTMFMTARMALLRGELRAWRQRPAGVGGTGKISYREFGKRIAYYHFIMPMMIQFIASGFRWEEDRQLIAALLGQLNSFVIFGDILVLAATEAVGSDQRAWSENEIPLAAITKEMWEGASAALDPDARADDMLAAIAEMGDVLGQFLGQPVDQVRNIMGGVSDVIEGDTEKGLKRIWGFSEKVAGESAEAPVFPK